MVQSASYPPLQRTQGTGHPLFRNGKGNTETWATRPNAGSVQNAVGLGNAKGVGGWLAGAFLGNNVSSAIDLIQAAWGGNGGGIANGAGQAFGSNVAVAGGKAVASQVPNVVAVNVSTATVSVSTATTTLTVQTATATAQTLPFGSIANEVTNTISGAFDGKLYFDIGIALLADYVCTKDRSF